MKVPHLSQFLDYRTFLAAHAAEQKRRNPRWSYGAWARRLGLGGTATITRIIQGDRNPGPKLVDKLVAYFDFSPLESEYFRNLVQWSRGAQTLGLDLPQSLGDPRICQRSVATQRADQSVFETIAHWYVLAIRELTRITGARMDPEWISRNFFFGVTSRQAAHALRLLSDTGLIALDQDGRVHKTEAAVPAAQSGAGEALCRYHEDMLDNARKSLRLKDSLARITTALTVVMQQDKIDAACSLIDELLAKISALGSVTEGDALYQLQVQFFPLLKGQS